MPSASRRRRRPRSRTTGERFITPKKPTPAYQARKAALTDDQVRLSLELVEEGIMVDPFHRDGRVEIGNIVYDRTEHGIVIAYSLVDGEAILLTFRDLFDSQSSGVARSRASGSSPQGPRLGGNDMSTSKANVDDDVIPEFDFSRAIPSPFRDAARHGMRLHITTDGAELPIFHVSARRRGRSWWVEIDEVKGAGEVARWSTIESTARQVIARSCGLDTSDFDLVIDLPPIK